MQRIGQWIKNLLDETFIAPQEIADTMEGALRVRVADYLAGAPDTHNSEISDTTARLNPDA